MTSHAARVLGPRAEFPRLRLGWLIGCFIACMLMTIFASSVHAAGLSLSPEAARALDQIYSGDPDAAIVTARSIQQSQPDHPLGYLLEDEAQWWKTFCAACEMKWGMLDAWKRAKMPQDDAYLALADKAIDLAHAQLAKSDTADMHVYLAVGFALKARLYSLLDERRAIAHAGVAARAECIRALELDPDMADATAALGLYNYYVDTLSGIAKMLRFFMGIPGGNKEEGIRQMKVGIDRGVILAVDSRFYLAKNLRTYDQKYEEAVSVADPLVERYPRNPVFQLLVGNLYAELGRNAIASQHFHAAQNSTLTDSECSARVRDLATTLLSALPKSDN
jgi:tetratricopeptide (TPR) repeat protein